MASTSYQAFETAIADAERLLVLFDKLPQQERQPNEVLKRAALIMTLTAWETYIEAWLNEQLCHKISVLKGSFAGDYIQKKLDIWHSSWSYMVTFVVSSVPNLTARLFVWW